MPRIISLLANKKAYLIWGAYNWVEALMPFIKSGFFVACTFIPGSFFIPLREPWIEVSPFLNTKRVGFLTGVLWISFFFFKLHKN